MTTEVDEVVTVAQGLQPNEIASLSVPRLIHDHEWLAVAAYAKAGPDQLADTLAHLAAATTDPVAFAWFWGLVSRPDSPNPEAGWSAFANLPSSVGVPAELADGVVAFIAEPGGRSSPRDHATGFLLQRLPTALARRASRTVLDASQEPETRPSTQAIDEAIVRLSQQRSSTDRDRVLGSVAERPPGERLALILHMSRPFRTEEIGVLQSALEETLPQPQPGPELIGRMQTAWHIMTLDGQRSLLTNQVASSSDRCRAFLTPSLLEPSGSDQVLEFLSSSQDAGPPAMSPALAAAIVEDLATTGESFGLELLDLAHGRLDAASLRPVPQRFVQSMQHWEPARRTAGLGALMRPAVRLGEVSIGEPLLKAILPEELPDVLDTVRLRNSEDARFLGTWLARYLTDGPSLGGMTSEQSSSARSDRVAEVVRALPKRRRVVVMTTLAESPIVELPAPVLRVALGELELARACTRAGRGAGLLGALSPDDTLGMTADNRCALLLTIVEHDPNDTVAEAALKALEADAEAYDDVRGPSEFASRIISALSGRPALLHSHAVRQINTLDRPQGEAAPPERLAPILDRALETGLAEDVPEPEMHIGLLISGHKLLHSIAARWLTAAVPTRALVELCALADDQYARKSPYPGARLAQASTLARRVADIGLETELRIESLRGSARANPAAGRAAALAVQPDYPVTLRRAAGKILSETQGALGDMDRLTYLAAEEDDAEALRLLEVALRKVHSGNVGEALNHLLLLVESNLDPTGVSVSVVLPRESLHDAFIAKVDAARASLSGAPAAAVNSLIDLGEVLVEWAIGYVFSMDAKHAGEGRRLLENAPNKPKVGDLVRRQHLLQKYPWLSSHAALREERSVHVAPAGSTRPVTIVDENVVSARHLTKTVVHGWIDVMYSVRDEVG